MTHVTITIWQEGEEVPYCKTVEYADKTAACDDTANIMEYITSHIK